MSGDTLWFPNDPESSHLRRLPDLFNKDMKTLVKKYGEYGPSWKAEGGHSAFFNLKRKWDRIYNQSKKQGWDIFKAFHADRSPQGIIDDIGDLRRYLALVEAELMEQVAMEIAETRPSRVVKEEGPRQNATMEDEARIPRVPRFEASAFEEQCRLQGVDPDAPDDMLPDRLFKLKYQDRDVLRNLVPGTNVFDDARRKVMLELEKSKPSVPRYEDGKLYHNKGL